MRDAQVSGILDGMHPARAGKPRILFFCESVSLAHLARPLALAAALDPERYDIHIASGDAFRQFFDACPFTRHTLTTISRDEFARRLSLGAPLYDEQTLEREVAEDLALMERVRPDLVIGDFRLSLAVSARVRKVPYALIANAYWSPAARAIYEPPPTLFTRMLPLPIVRFFFNRFRSAIFAQHASAHNAVRARRSLPLLQSDIAHLYTDADTVLYADLPELFSECRFLPTEKFLGLVTWSPEASLPSAVAEWVQSREPSQLCYVTLGSSGASDLLPLILRTLGTLPLCAVVSSAGTVAKVAVPPNVLLVPFVSGDSMASRADLIISNGGSATTNQALAAGKPIIGIASNMDQMLNMQRIASQGAGILLRADRLTTKRLASAITRVLVSSSFSESASRIGALANQHDFKENFRQFVAQSLS